MKVKEGAGFIWEKTSRLNLTYHIGLWDQAKIFYIWDHVFIFGIMFSYLAPGKADGDTREKRKAV